MPQTPASLTLADRLAEIEERLARLLVSGWRSAAAEARDLERLATGLADAGASGLAARLSSVAAATSNPDALRAITLATATCRILRANLAADATPPGNWRTLGDAPGARPLDRVIPLGRFAFPGGDDADPVDAWSCLRLRGAFSADWILLEPANAAPDWLRRPLHGRLRWTGRLPLGDGGEVQVCRLEYAAPAPGFQGGQDPLEPFRETLAAGSLADDAWILGGGGVLRSRRSDPDELGGYAWPLPDAPDRLRPAMREAEWMLVWVQDQTETPVVALRSDGSVVHLSER